MPAAVFSHKIRRLSLPYTVVVRPLDDDEWLVERTNASAAWTECLSRTAAAVTASACGALQLEVPEWYRLQADLYTPDGGLGLGAAAVPMHRGILELLQCATDGGVRLEELAVDPHVLVSFLDVDPRQEAAPSLSASLRRVDVSKYPMITPRAMPSNVWRRMLECGPKGRTVSVSIDEATATPPTPLTNGGGLLRIDALLVGRRPYRFNFDCMRSLVDTSLGVRFTEPYGHHPHCVLSTVPATLAGYRIHVPYGVSDSHTLAMLCALAERTTAHLPPQHVRLVLDLSPAVLRLHDAYHDIPLPRQINILALLSQRCAVHPRLALLLDAGSVWYVGDDNRCVPLLSAVSSPPRTVADVLGWSTGSHWDASVVDRANPRSLPIVPPSPFPIQAAAASPVATDRGVVGFCSETLCCVVRRFAVSTYKQTAVMVRDRHNQSVNALVHPHPDHVALMRAAVMRQIRSRLDHHHQRVVTLYVHGDDHRHALGHGTLLCEDIAYRFGLDRVRMFCPTPDADVLSKLRAVQRLPHTRLSMFAGLGCACRFNAQRGAQMRRKVDIVVIHGGAGPFTPGANRILRDLLRRHAFRRRANVYLCVVCDDPHDRAEADDEGDLMLMANDLLTEAVDELDPTLSVEWAADSGGAPYVFEFEIHPRVRP